MSYAEIYEVIAQEMAMDHRGLVVYEDTETLEDGPVTYT